MIDGRSTTDDWQRFRGKVCVLPVGSFEQHGSHLPLATDILCAEFFAGMLADELPAALLPALPFGTCMEHSGFRGSVSLRPETLMQILRDVADEVERQQFRVLVVVNGHGGNFALAPVVRDINRRDRPLKALLVDWWEQAQQPGVATESAARGLDLHAGDMETSVVLAIRPDLVRPERAADRPDGGPPEAFPLLQRDLNSFGVGHFSPGGVVGYPSLATAEKGQAFIDSARARLVPFVRDRIRRLTEQPRYAGGGGIAVRPMGPDDLADGMRLKTLAGWNQTEADWRLFLEGPSADGLVAVHDGRVVGTATIMRYGDDLAWIGMMLVDPAFRRLGIGRLLLTQALAGVASGRAAVKLDATLAGKALYDTMGFVDESRLHRLTHASLPPLPEPAGGGACAAVTEQDWDGIDALDRSVFGADRGRVLRALATQDPPRALRLGRAGRVEGYCFTRPGTRYHQIGPIIAGNVDDATLLATVAMRGLVGRPAVLDVPDAQPEFLRRLGALGFARERSFVRMVRAPAAPPAAPEDRIFAICGPEFG